MDDLRTGILNDASITRDRVAALAAFAAGRRTLNVGCTGSRPGRGATAGTLDRHLKVVEQASECLGIDLDSDGVADLTRRGLDAQVADACTCDLGRTFQAIIAGEIIEHVSNGGLFLENMGRHLDPDGILAVSTCNPFYVKQQWKILRHGHPGIHSQHAAWYDPITLMELADRHGLAPVQLIWVRERRGFDPRLWKRRLRRYFNSNFIMVFTPRRDADDSGKPNDGKA